MPSESSAADELTRASARARKAAQREEKALTEAYAAQLRSAGQQAARRYKTIAGLGLAAAADWTPPSTADVLAIQVRTARIRAAQRRMLGRIAGVHNRIRGVDFDLTAPYPQHLLDQLGLRAAQLGDHLREPVAHAIARGWAEGVSVPKTATYIREAVGQEVGWRATMLARTDLIGLSNGGNDYAARQLNEAAKEAGERPPIQSKTWLTARDARVRDTHQSADGQTVPMNQPFTVGGEQLQYPGDPAGSNAETINCRCTTLYGEEEPVAPKVETPQEDPDVSFEKFMPIAGRRWGANAYATSRTGAQQTITALDRAVPKAAPRLYAAYKEMFPDKDEFTVSAGEIGMKEYGRYEHTGTSPLRIVISHETPHPATTMAHGVGHYIDHTALMKERGFLSETPTHMVKDEALRKAASDFRVAAEGSDTIQAIRRVLSTSRGTTRRGGSILEADLSEKGRAYGEYLVRGVEIWARAFSQWLARNADNKALAAEMRDTIEHERRPADLMILEFKTQWDDADVAWLDEAVERVLRAAGLLDDALAGSGMHFAEVRVGPLVAVEGSDPGDGALAADAQPGGDRILYLVLRDAERAEGGNIDHQEEDTAAAAGTDAGQGVALHGANEEAAMTVVEEQLAAEEEALTGAAWEADVAYEGLSTGDGRYMAEGSLRWREPPLTLMAMVETTEGGHLGAQVAGRMDGFAKRKATLSGERLPAGVTSVYSTGVFDIGEYATDIERMVATDVLTGISVDLAIHEWAFRDPETGDIIDPDAASDEEWERAFMGEYELAVLDGEIMAATVCPTPAFADAKIALLAASRLPGGRAWRANLLCAERYGVQEGQMMMTLTGSISLRAPEPLTAAATLTRPTRDGFFVAEPDGPQPLTYREGPDGLTYVTGHLATWDQCHTGYVNGVWTACVTPPRSKTGYALFHVGEMPTAEGDLVPIGKIMVGDGGHAATNLSAQAARAFYDRTGHVGAYVRAVDGKHGIWLSGVVEERITDAQRRDLHANPQSGDWRSHDYNLELITAVTVPVPGFPVPRSQLALAASADGSLYVSALILTGGVTAEQEEEASALHDAIDGGDSLHALIEG
jgi:hypothetical protein